MFMTLNVSLAIYKIHDSLSIVLFFSLNLLGCHAMLFSEDHGTESIGLIRLACHAMLFSEDHDDTHSEL